MAASDELACALRMMGSCGGFLCYEDDLCASTPGGRALMRHHLSEPPVMVMLYGERRRRGSRLFVREVWIQGRAPVPRTRRYAYGEREVLLMDLGVLWDFMEHMVRRAVKGMLRRLRRLARGHPPRRDVRRVAEAAVSALMPRRHIRCESDSDSDAEATVQLSWWEGSVEDEEDYAFVRRVLETHPRRRADDVEALRALELGLDDLRMPEQ